MFNCAVNTLTSAPDQWPNNRGGLRSCILYIINYAVALRCIGQVLQQQNVEVFEIKTRPGEFRLECGDTKPPYTKIIRLDYSVDAIKILDREAQAHRGQSRAEFRFDSISEVLRAIGEYIDSKRAHLRRLSNTCFSDPPALKIEYETRAGDIVSETLAMSFVRETGVRMYKKRTRIPNPISVITRA